MKSFAIINPIEVSELGQLKASGCAVLIYITLARFSRNKGSCFPCINTILYEIGGKYTTRAVHKALKWLEDNKIIKRNEKSSKQRFILLKRLKAIGTKVHKAYKEQKFPLKETSKKNSFFKSWKQKKDYFSLFEKKKKTLEVKDIKSDQNEGNDKAKCEAENIFGTWMIKTPSMNVKTISKADLSVIVRCLNSQEPQDVEWREIMSWSPSNRKCFDEILSL